jgi:hypothetical protein
VKKLRRELPPEPARHKDLDDHILGEEFRKAELDHLQSVTMESWTEVSKEDPETRGAQVLACMWVYVYPIRPRINPVRCSQCIRTCEARRESLYENAAWLSEARQNIEVESSTLWYIGHMINQERSHESYDFLFDE